MSEQVTVKQFRSMPTIVSMMTLYPDGGQHVDVVAFADGRVLVIAGDGIELWPSMDALLSSDPDGDFREMIGFIEYEEGPSPTYALGVFWRETTRFGRAVQGFIGGAFIRALEDGKLLLRDGRYLELGERSISLWDDDVDEALGLLGMMTWEAA